MIIKLTSRYSFNINNLPESLCATKLRQCEKCSEYLFNNMSLRTTKIQYLKHPGVPGNLQKRSKAKTSAGPFQYQCIGRLFVKVCLEARWEASVYSDELGTLLWMSVCLLIMSFKLSNRFTYLNLPIKWAGKVCGDSQDLTLPGKSWNHW